MPSKARVARHGRFGDAETVGYLFLGLTFLAGRNDTLTQVKGISTHNKEHKGKDQNRQG